jgi:HEAT repeat protein
MIFMRSMIHLNLRTWRVWDRRKTGREAGSSCLRLPEVDLAATLGQQIPRYIGLLKDPDPNIYFTAVRKLDRIWDSEDETADKDERQMIMEGFEKALDDKDPEMRRRVVSALGVVKSIGRMDSHGKKTGLADYAVTWAGHRLHNDKNAKVRCAAAWALGNLGDMNLEAEPLLIKALNNDKEEEEVRRSAANSLKKLGTEGLGIMDRLKIRHLTGRLTAAERWLVGLVV